MKKNKKSMRAAGKITNSKMTRNKFLKTTAFLGGSALIMGSLEKAHADVEKALADAAGKEYILSKPENMISTVCLQCNTGCGIKVKTLEGLAVKVEGNPFSPWTMMPHLPYGTSFVETAPLNGALCPKGQSGIQSLYDPYRIVKVLKRKGSRGSNQWETIDFKQAVSEIVDGGKLFSGVKGEEDREVEGLNSIWAVRDAKTAKDMEKDLGPIKKVIKDVHGKKATEEDLKKAIEKYKEKHKKHLDKLIDPDHPDFGLKNNQLLIMWGRQKGGRGDFVKRFGASFGTTNMHGHTTVCQGSLYFSGKAASEQYDFVEKDKGAKWGNGAKFYFQADTANVKFLLEVGSAIFEGGYGPTPNAKKLMENIEQGKVKIAVADPRYSKLASKAEKWMPIKPGTEAAFALAMIRWIIENEKYQAGYLKNANKGAAKKAKEPNWTTASWLVKIVDGKPEKYLYGSDVGIAKKKKLGTDSKTGESIPYELDQTVVYADGKPLAFDPNDDAKAAFGDLFVDTEINGIKVKSALQIVKDEAFKKSIDEWAKICDIKKEDVVWCAEQLTSYGRQAVADIHRGVSQHTNGFYNVFAYMVLNMLIGNYDYKGGYVAGKSYAGAGDKSGQPHNLGSMHPGKLPQFGISIIRHDVKYEETTVFSGYPAKRQWFPLASDIYQEILPSAGDQYPYPIKAVISYCGAPTYALPGGNGNIQILKDVKKIPLFIANDITVGNTSIYADYIFPDVTYLERFDFLGTHPSVTSKVGPIFQPVVEPLTEKVTIFGEETHMTYESMLMGIAEKMKLPGFGRAGFGYDSDGAPRDFNHPDDFYLRYMANVAYGDKSGSSDAVPNAGYDEMSVFEKARAHLSKATFDIARWKKAAGSANWKKVVYLLNRGGRSVDYSKMFDKEMTKDTRYGKQLNMYWEKAAGVKNAISGKKFPGYPTYLEIADSMGNPINDEANGYNLNLLTYRDVTQTKSRTVTNYWLLNVLPENSILMNPKDAERLGFGDGSKARVVSHSNPEGVWDLLFTKKPMVGKVKVTEGIRPGCVSFCLGFGHWGYGAYDITIDGTNLKADVRRGKGIHANAAMRLDNHVKNTSLQDNAGGSVAFYDTKVKLVKA